MSLTSRVKVKLFDTMMTAFDKIGVANSMAMPTSKRNDEAIAWELMVADEMRRRANKRREAAFSSAVDAGLIPASFMEAKGAVAKQEVWRGEHVSIIGVVIKKKGTLDTDKFIERLKAYGVSLATITKAYDDAARPAQLQKTFDTIPIVVD